MRRLILGIPVFTAIGLMAAALPPTAMNAQSVPALYHESHDVMDSGDANGKILSSEAQGGVSREVHPSVVRAQGSGDKPFYAELMERVVELGRQILKKATDIAPPTFAALDWKLQTALILTAFAALVGIFLKLKERAWPKINYPAVNTPVTRPPSDLPAAAVSVLEHRRFNQATVLAALVEMCQKGMMQVIGIGVTPGRTIEGKNYAGEYEYIYRGKYIYCIVPKDADAAQFEWERAILHSIPRQPMTIDGLTDSLGNTLYGQGRAELISRTLGEHLRYRGLFTDNPIQVMEDANRGFLALALGVLSVLVGVGLLSSWLLSAWVSWPWWANLACSAVVGIVFAFIYIVIAEPKRIGHITPTRAGLLEISRWLALRDSLSEIDPSSDAGRSDSLLPYAIAFDKAEKWLQGGTPAPFWLTAVNLREYTSEHSARPVVPFALRRTRDDLTPHPDEAYHAFMSADGWLLSGSSEQAAEAAVCARKNPRYDPPSSGTGGGNGNGGNGGGGNGGGA